MKQDLFHIVFMVSLFSVAIQGTLLPNVAKKLGMVDDNADVRKTFNDYKGDSWCKKAISELKISKHKLIAMVIRDNQPIIPDGKTIILENDAVVFITVK